MDPRLERYLAAIVVLQSVTVGYLATILWATAERVSLTFLLIPPLLVGAVVSAVVRWALNRGSAADPPSR
ncbi:MAG: hypothetical protein ABEJ76_07155 [Halanaeroarchaeum sp.]